MTTTHPSPMVEGPCATYDLLTSISWGGNFELEDLTNTLIDWATAYGMDASTKNSKIMINSTNISADISTNGQKLEEVTSFKYLGATLCKNGTCSAEICIRIASAMAAMSRLNKNWWLYSINSQASSSCTSLTSPPASPVAIKHGPCLLTEKRIQAFKTKCLRKLVCYLVHKTNNWVRSKMWVHRNLF